MARKTIQEKIDFKENKIRQMSNELKKLKEKEKEIQRNKRTKRLIEKGAIFESLVKESKNFSSEEYKTLIEVAISTDEFKTKLLEIMEENQNSNSEEENTTVLVEDDTDVDD